jgi:hypothetical protein
MINAKPTTEARRHGGIAKSARIAKIAEIENQIAEYTTRGKEQSTQNRRPFDLPIAAISILNLRASGVSVVDFPARSQMNASRHPGC